MAKSQDLTAAVTLAAAVGALAITGPATFHRLQAVVAEGIVRIGDPSQVSAQGIGSLFRDAGGAFVSAAAPVVAASLAAGLLANVAQVRFRVTPRVVRPSLRRIDPAQGFKRVFGKSAPIETLKAAAKVGVVGAVAFFALYPAIGPLAGYVGIAPAEIGGRVGGMALGIAERVLGALLLLGFADWLWQRRKHEKELRMTKEEVKKEARQSDTSPQVKKAQAKRRFEMSRRRMLTDVPAADVVVVNPTHFAVALAYDASRPAPQVVAKGQDLMAAAIRRIAEEHGVPVLANPPLARALYRDVEVGHLIPEDVFQAVAEVLAFVYRTAGRRRSAARRRTALRAGAPVRPRHSSHAA